MFWALVEPYPSVTVMIGYSGAPSFGQCFIGFRPTIPFHVDVGTI